MAGASFFSELRKRKVLQSAAIYGAIAWGVTEVAVTIVEHLFLPQWVSTLAVIFFVVGFPVAMFLAWTFDLTSEGIRRTAVSSRRGAATIMASLALMLAGTAGLFVLIKPALEDREGVASEAPAVAANSVAVLPFVIAGGGSADHDYLVTGLSDELRDQLGRVPGLRIAARSSSVAAANQSLDAESMTERLGVAKWVEGSVRRQGNLLLVSVQLIDSSNGLALWSDTFERGSQELLNVQQAIAEAVIRNVLPDAEGVVSEPATRVPSANELMLQARSLEQQVRARGEVDAGTLLEAIRLYRRVTELDPGSALGHSRLARALIYLGDLAAAEAPIFKALSINPELSEVQNTLGEFHWARGLVREAGIAWARAVEIDPDNPDALSSYAFSLWYQSEMKGVKELFERALDRDPLNLKRYAELGAFLGMLSHHDEARLLAEKIEELFDGAAAWRVIADIEDLLGEVDRSIAWTIRARDLEPDNPAHRHKLAEFYADIKDAETAISLDPNGIGILFKLRRFDEMIDLAEFAMIDDPTNLRIRSVLAIAYNATGQFESAIHVLRSTGLPDSVLNGWRSTEEMDGYIALMNATFAIGEVETARKLAQFVLYELGVPNSDDWFMSVTAACAHSILGEDDETRRSLRRARKGLHLVWDPLLKDSPCFARFRENPEYQATVEYFDERRVMLRNRLPDTLEEFGVKLQSVSAEVAGQRY